MDVLVVKPFVCISDGEQQTSWTAGAYVKVCKTRNFSAVDSRHLQTRGRREFFSHDISWFYGGSTGHRSGLGR